MVQVQAWLDAYVAAWRSYERDAIVALFTDDVAVPATSPVSTSRCAARRRSPTHGWQDAATQPGTWEAEYAPALIAGRRRSIATGETRYTDGEVVLEPVGQLEFAARRALLALRRVVRALHTAG